MEAKKTNTPPSSFLDSTVYGTYSYAYGAAVCDINSDGVQRDGKTEPFTVVNPYLIKTRWCGHWTWLALTKRGDIYEINDHGGEFLWEKSTDGT